MNTALFFDTETTGLPLFKEPSEHPDQPHLVQLAACLVDLDTRQTLASMDVMIRPDGWVIPDEVAAIHGITTEMAMDLGAGEQAALDMFLSLWGNKRTRIAHNESFDARIIRIAQLRYGYSEGYLNDWKEGVAICTQKLSTPICKIPPTAKMMAAKRFHHKSANLGEAYQFFTGMPLQNAHSAMADVEGCIAVYFGVQDHGRTPEPAAEVINSTFESAEHV